jgi:hypothetical protein
MSLHICDIYDMCAVHILHVYYIYNESNQFDLRIFLSLFFPECNKNYVAMHQESLL